MPYNSLLLQSQPSEVHFPTHKLLIGHTLAATNEIIETLGVIKSCLSRK